MFNTSVPRFVAENGGGGGGQQKESGTGKAKDEILLEGEVPLLCVRRTRTSQSARTASQCVD